MIIHQLNVGPMGVCCYIIACEKTLKGAIIDPGGDEEQILTTCDRQNISVEYIIATHAHPDHVCGNSAIKKATGAPIVMHGDEAAFISRPEISQFFAQLGLAASPPADRLVRDGDTINFGEVSLRVIHTPGHTPGGICLYAAPNLFAGDTLFVGSVGRTDFPGGNTDQMLNAIREKLLVLPPDTVVWPGHGYGGDHSTIAAEKAGNPFLTGKW